MRTNEKVPSYDCLIRESQWSPHLLGSCLPRGFDAAHGGLDGVGLVSDAAADVSDGG